MECTLTNFVGFCVGYAAGLFSFLGALALVAMGDKDE